MLILHSIVSDKLNALLIILCYAFLKYFHVTFVSKYNISLIQRYAVLRAKHDDYIFLNMSYL